MPIKIRTRVSVGDAAIEDFHAFLEDYPYPEAEKVEVMAGEYFDDWVEHVDAGSARANRILALLVLRQKDPDLALKEPYDPGAAAGRLDDHASHFVSVLESALKDKDSGVVVALYDTELFGHWWFEGPEWIYRMLKALSYIGSEGRSAFY